MDLVDIDKVLDNLELREAADEHNKQIALNQQKSLHTASANGIVILPPAQATTTTATTTTAITTTTSTNNKGFIGVSQVFNSLDDYQKNVESLDKVVQKYDEECRPIGINISSGVSWTTNNTTNTVQQNEHTRRTNNCNDAPTTSKVVNIFKHENSSEPEHDNDKNDDDDDNDNDDDDVDEKNVNYEQYPTSPFIVEEDEDDDTNDLQKYVEPKKSIFATKDFDGEDITDSSDSLTTSSPSTFSSGPSPGLCSTTDERLTPLSPVNVEEQNALLAAHEEQQQNLQQNEEQNQQQQQQQQQHHQQVKKQLDATTASISVLTDSYAPTAERLDDLVVGLSSISLTTGNLQSQLPGEATMSSVLGNVLEDLSEPTPTSLLSQMRDVDVKDKTKQGEHDYITSLTASQAEYEAPQNVANLALQQTHQIDTKLNEEQFKLPTNQQMQQNAIKQPVQQQQPVTFGSTMDEISDTELDSMLQEMDIDDVGEDSMNLKPNNMNLKQTTDISVVREPVLIATTTAMPIVASKVETQVDDLTANADSFSQASTVEFSEIRTQPLQQPVIEESAQYTNSIASSYTSSSESSLDGVEIGTDDDDNNADADADADGDGDGDDDYDDENSEHRDSATAQQCRPQRPTTLDLPALKMSNLLANAGQTPPGTAINPNLVGATTTTVTTTAAATVDDDDVTAVAASGTVENSEEEIAEAAGYSDPHANLGKIPPIWVPDNMATACMQCHAKFTMIKRRHHCRACGQCICSVCCSQKFKLEFLQEPESRICVQCYLILTQRQQKSVTNDNELNVDSLRDVEIHDNEAPSVTAATAAIATATATGTATGTATATAAATATETEITSTPMRSPNPNNPMEYCSTIPPHRQVTTTSTKPPSVIVPVGVLKKDSGGSYSSNSSNSSGKTGRKRKSVMFSDGIAPGSELAGIEHQWSEAKHARRGHGDKTRSSGPSTPLRTENDTSSAMGLMASLFRGALPPVAAAAAVSLVQGASSHKEDVRVKPTTNVTVAKSTSSAEKKSATQRVRRLPPSGADEQGCFIPKEEQQLPPLIIYKDSSVSEFDYKEVNNNFDLIERLQRETLKFALEKNFYVLVKIVHLKCCMNRTVINFTTQGMHHVGNDEIIILLEYELPPTKDKMLNPPIPKDIFIHLYEIYRDAELGNPIGELSYTSPKQTNFLGSRDYGGFIYIRVTFQCLQEIIIPENPYLIGILIHRYEVPWAKIFPLRLMLRLGAQYRYYPCPHISIRNRESVYAEIAQTIINFLADFRNYSYTLPSIRGMYIHMEDRQTTVLIPRNRQEDVIKAINNSSDHILAFGGNFSKSADGHLVCMQNVNDNQNELYSYSTQAINIQGQPRKVTGASFFVLNEALKTTSGLSGKCSIVEDGLMVQILPTKMEEVRNALRNQNDIDIVCGPINAEESQTETVSIKWVDKDRDFNNGVKSPIDERSMEGISSMRVHASFNYSNTNYSIRLTDIYILKFDAWYNALQGALAATSMDITRMSEQIARSASMALVPFLDLLVTSGCKKIALRATLHQENVCYEAGALGVKLPPLYMNALDNHLIPTLHNESTGIEDAIILELIFYILNV